MVTVYLKDGNNAPVKQVDVRDATSIKLGDFLGLRIPGAQGDLKALECTNAQGKTVALFRIETVVGYEIVA